MTYNTIFSPRPQFSSKVVENYCREGIKAMNAQFDTDNALSFFEGYTIASPSKNADTQWVAGWVLTTNSQNEPPTELGNIALRYACFPKLRSFNRRLNFCCKEGLLTSNEKLEVCSFLKKRAVETLTARRAQMI